MTQENLFYSLFKYRPRPNRNPLEDFVTEIIAYLLKKDSKLLKQYLSLIAPHSSSQIDSYNIDTQYLIKNGRRIDMVITWSCDYKKCSLFVEHKVDSVPWQTTNDKGENQTQVDEYCKYQDVLNSKSKEINNYVVLVSRYHLGSQAVFLKSPSYLGNFTWDQIVDVIKKRIKEASPSNINQFLFLEQEFINFMRRYSMAGFENLNISELSCIGHYKTYSEKIYSLNTSIIKSLSGVTEGYFKKFKLTKIEISGADNVANHYGLLFHNDKNNAGNADLWILFGLSTENPDTNDRWYLDLLHKEEQIPDVEVAIYMWFENHDDASNFKKNHLQKINEQNFKVKIQDDYLVIIKRKSLLDFLKSDHQENDIINFLKDGVDEMTSDDQYEKIINAFQNYS